MAPVVNEIRDLRWAGGTAADGQISRTSSDCRLLWQSAG